MKKILITGKNSYVGNSFEKWLKENYPKGYQVNKISLRDNSWIEHDFSVYDVVLHVAGIAHRKETKENKNLYFRVNRDLTYEVAKKAKADGVSQFIFVSSMSIYGLDTGIINRYTKPLPNSYYGKSKLEGEQLIKTLDDDFFKVVILRPPMIYGENCKGNYVLLSKLARKTPVFPMINNKRSMIYIANFSEFIRRIVDNNLSGIYYPQNSEYVCTSELVKLIADCHNKKILFTKLFNPIISILNIKIIKKAFGSLVYDKSLSEINDIQYEVVDLKDSVKLTEDSKWKPY